MKLNSHILNWAASSGQFVWDWIWSVVLQWQQPSSDLDLHTESTVIFSHVKKTKQQNMLFKACVSEGMNKKKTGCSICTTLLLDAETGHQTGTKILLFTSMLKRKSLKTDKHGWEGSIFLAKELQQLEFSVSWICTYRTLMQPKLQLNLCTSNDL